MTCGGVVDAATGELAETFDLLRDGALGRGLGVGRQE